MTTMFTIPPAHREPDTDRTAAMQILGCDEETLTSYVHNGLPITNDHFDSRDLFNLGLHSGTGRTVPEQAFAFSLRWMRASTESLLAPRRSTFELTVTCDCGAPSTLARPRSERYEGAVLDLTPPTDNELVESDAVTATLHTRGALTPLRSPALQDIVRDFGELGVRWVKLPDALRDDPTLVTTDRVASCESASRYLATQCAQAGLEAKTRIGWVVGMLDLVHAWVEVADDDGVTKLIDPVFALFATTIPGANPLLNDPTVALRTNRLIPTGLPVGARVATHRCPNGRVSTKIQPVKEPR